ncbi:MAG: ribonuclease HIII [Lentisphaerae bacterium GWF2_52_8]|nr:MAG: ribonuclease HIII [Lentisphaerae bacterium GWF2_52_8]
MDKTKKIHSHVSTLSEQQREKLAALLAERNWSFAESPYTYWCAKKDKTKIAAYQSGKLVTQGPDTEDFVTFILEPEILGVASLGYEEEKKPAAQFSPHAGLDESGKGDFFGPLVVASAFVDKGQDGILLKAGIKDCKLIKSEQRISSLAAKIRETLQGNFAVVAIGPEAYNRLYDSFGNLNRLLAWGHARALEDLLEKTPACNEVLADKFGDERLIQRALMEKGRKIRLEQRTKAESDIAVAAASILARDEFLRRMKSLSEQWQLTLPRGASSAVEDAAVSFVERNGAEKLGKVAKMHFRTSAKVLGLGTPDLPRHDFHLD